MWWNRVRKCRWPEGCSGTTKAWTGQLCELHFNEARPRWVVGRRGKP